jgi:hypothetical protein
MNKELPPRYVNCVLINGWGNVFQEAVSCFLFSLFTDRAAIFNTAALDGYMPFQWAFPSKLFITKRNANLTDVPFDAYNMKVINGIQEKLVRRFELPCFNWNDVANETLVTIHCKQVSTFKSYHY